MLQGKIKANSFKRGQSGGAAWLTNRKKAFFHVAPLRFNSISTFRGIEIGKPLAGARGGATKHCLAPRVLSTPHFSQFITEKLVLGF